MTQREIKNLAASVHQRLLDRARRDDRPFNSILQHYAMERFLYRLSRSPHADSFLLKGALMLQVWRLPVPRHTLDIDLLGRIDNDPASLISVLRGVCTEAVQDDGMTFDADSVRAEPITADAEYVGIRGTFKGRLGNARVAMQVDVGIGDSVVGAGPIEDYPVLLDFPAPRLRGYSRETSIAEKFQAMIQRGRLNSRVKDYFDIWLLSTHFEFDGQTLAAAIGATLERRRTSLPDRIEALDDEFANVAGRARQWEKFLERNLVADSTPDLEEVLRQIRTFLLPVGDAVRDERPFHHHWSPGGPWRA